MAGLGVPECLSTCHWRRLMKLESTKVVFLLAAIVACGLALTPIRFKADTSKDGLSVARLEWNSVGAAEHGGCAAPAQANCTSDDGTVWYGVT